MYYVYAIRSKSYSYIYVGMTSSLHRRIAQHNDGKEKTTKHYAPFELIHTEHYLDRRSARSAERYLKSGAGKEFLKSLP